MACYLNHRSIWFSKKKKLPNYKKSQTDESEVKGNFHQIYQGSQNETGMLLIHMKQNHEIALKMVIEMQLLINVTRTVRMVKGIK